MKHDFALLIGGALVPGASTLDVINPSTGAVFATAPRSDRALLERAVTAARQAAPGWTAIGVDARSAAICKVADALEADAEEFARLLTEEQGKPIAQSRGELGAAVATLRYFASLRLPDEVIKSDNRQRVIKQYLPLGVVAAITPWNFPLNLLMLKAGPAWLAGNTVVAKPAPTTPLTTLAFGELVQDLLPPGVLNIVVDNNDLGPALTEHPDIAKVSFTGSSATGRKVMASGSSTLKRLTLELGGNDAAIVLDDVDPKAVAPDIFAKAIVNAGQVCLAIKRLYVHSSRYDAMCVELARLAGETVVDDGFTQGVTMGPLQNKAQYERAKLYLDDAAASGTLVAGGRALPRDGYFVEPTIVRDIPDSARVVREEQFAPILPVLAYDDIDDAVARANDTEYGLGASVWSGDTERAIAVANQLVAGNVWVNTHFDAPADIPLFGAKQSGLGAEMGREGLEAFTQVRVINIAL